MEIKIRLLTGQTKTIEVDKDANVAHLKDIFSEDYIRETIKFVFKGKILASEDTQLISIDMDENDALVLVGKKKTLHEMKKPPQKPTMADAFKAARNIGANEKVEKIENGQSSANAQISSIPVSDDVIENIVSMGFDRALVLEALKKAFYNPVLAIEYCLSGEIQTRSDESVESSDALSSSRSDDLIQLQNLLSGQTQEKKEETVLVKALRELPNFDQLRSLAAGKESTFIPAIIEEIEKSYPDTHRLIQNEPEEFMRLISQGLPTTSTSTQVRLDPEAIERLMNIGNFSRQEATQAYLLANRDENIAASILFEAQEQQTMRMDKTHDY